MTNSQKLLDLLHKKEKVIALLAPAFCIDFQFPNIIFMLKKLGVDIVTELTFGAKMVNRNYIKYIKNNKQKYYIASACPMSVNIIKNKFPNLIKYLIPVVSPMVAMGEICKKHYPNHKTLFIGPCDMKISEAYEFKKFIDVAINFTDLQNIFDKKNIKSSDFDGKKANFDRFFNEYTKIYPLSGGLSSTSKIKKIFKEKDICVVDGIKEITQLCTEIEKNMRKEKFFDILGCFGGCVGGPSIINKIKNVKEKSDIIIRYSEVSSRLNMMKKMGRIKDAKGLKFKRKF